MAIFCTTETKQIHRIFFLALYFRFQSDLFILLCVVLISQETLLIQLLRVDINKLMASQN